MLMRRAVVERLHELARERREEQAHVARRHGPRDVLCGRELLANEHEVREDDHARMRDVDAGRAQPRRVGHAQLAREWERRRVDLQAAALGPQREYIDCV